MKKHYYTYGIMLLALILPSGAIAHAEDGMTLEGSVSAEATVNAPRLQPLPPKFPPNAPESLRQRIRADYELRMENMKNNQGVRNAMLERHASSSMNQQENGTNDGETADDATSTPGMRRPEPRGMPERFGKMASSTMGEMGDRGRSMREAFEMRKRFITHQFDIALRNLHQIRERINSRIEKSQAAGRDMSNAVTLLATADAKIQIAVDAVSALNTHVGTASTTANITASTTVNIDTARQLANTAQKAIKEAQRALNAVVVAVAHSMGLKLGIEEHATTTATASTTSQ